MAHSDTRTLLVTGATGKQGGAVISALLANPPRYPHKILALTRSPTSAASKALAAKSPLISLLEGSLDDCETVFSKAGGVGAVWAVFSVQVPSMKKGEEGKEEEQGCALVDAALANGVQVFVYSSVDRGGDQRSPIDPTSIPHFISKFNIEKHLMERAKGTEMTYTVLRPVAFMDNIQAPAMFGKLFAAMWMNMGDTKLQLVSARDIGVFAAMALAEPEKEEFKNKAIGLAGDDLTQLEADRIFFDIYLRHMPRSYGFLGSFLQYMVKEIGVMFQWFVDVGYGVKTDECRKIHPGMQDLKTWLKEESNFTR